MSSFGRSFGALVRHRRGIEGLTQADLAALAFNDGELKSRISDLENGKVKKPHQKTVDAISVALNISKDEILDLKLKAEREDDLRYSDLSRGRGSYLERFDFSMANLSLHQPEITNDISPPVLRAILLSNIADTYLKRAQLEASSNLSKVAIDHLRQAFDLLNEDGSAYQKIVILNKMGLATGLFADLTGDSGDLEQAAEYFMIAHEMASKLVDK